MKDVAIDARAACRVALRGNVSYNSKPVGVYGKIVPSDVEMPYIYFPDQTTSNASSKDCFSNDHTLNVEIVHSTLDGDEEWATDEIANQVKGILARLHQIDYPTWGSSFHFVEVTFVSDQELKHFVKEKWVFRKILVFNLLMDEA